MGRIPGAKNMNNRSQYRSFESPTPRSKGFVRLSWGLLNHPVFTHLSPSAKVLLIDMFRVAAGKPEITYAQSLANNIMATNTFKRARDELIDAGFIYYINAHCAKDKKEAAKFRFGDKWHGLWHSID